MDALDAIRHRRAVRSYTDAPVADEDIDRLLRLTLLAPTGHMAQAWGFVVVREDPRRSALADLVLRGGADYFREARPAKEGTSAQEHAAWAQDYAEQVLGTYREVPVWICGFGVPRFSMDNEVLERIERFSDVTSVSFAFENLFVAARAMGLGTAPTIFHLFYEDEYRELLNVPDDVETHYITPLGHPTQFPEGLPPALAASRRPWRSLVHDESWGNTRAEA